tara:strand:- start:531 stop:635 length:105 start_codon:yes stop_codon:yes gene_type:complete
MEIKYKSFSKKTIIGIMRIILKVDKILGRFILIF